MRHTIPTLFGLAAALCASTALAQTPPAPTGHPAFDSVVSRLWIGGLTSGTDLSLGTVRATGATASITPADRAARHRSVVDFGADPFFLLDSTTAIQAAINAVCAAGGGDLEFPGKFRVSATLTASCSNLHLLGPGFGQLHADNTWDAQSRLVWTGAFGGTLMVFAPPAGAAKGIAYSDASGILFDCNSIAAVCLDIASVRNGTWHVAYNNPVAGTYLTAGIVVDTVNLVGEYNDTQNNDFWIHGGEFGPGGRGVLFQAKARSSMIYANGSTTLTPYFGNVSYNTIHEISLRNWRGTALTVREADNLTFETVNIGGPTLIPAAYPVPNYDSGYSIILEGCQAGDTWCFTPITNIFDHVGTAGPILSQGTDSPGVTMAAGSNPVPQPNIFRHIDHANGSPDPTVGVGSYVQVGDLWGNQQGAGGYGSLFSDGRDALQTLRTKGYGTSGGAVFHANVGPAVRIASADMTKVAGVTVTNDGNVSLAPGAAAAGFVFRDFGGSVIASLSDAGLSLPTVSFPVDPNGGVLVGVAGGSGTPHVDFAGLGQSLAGRLIEATANTFTLQGANAASLATFGAGNITSNGYLVPQLVAYPASSTSPCTFGQIAVSSTYTAICISTNLWKRDAHDTAATW